MGFAYSVRYALMLREGLKSPHNAFSLTENDKEMEGRMLGEGTDRGKLRRYERGRP